jgi:hypothetical protein
MSYWNLLTEDTKYLRLIEKATTQPIKVINVVFDQVSLSDITDYLRLNWLRVAVINAQSHTRMRMGVRYCMSSMNNSSRL